MLAGSLCLTEACLLLAVTLTATKHEGKGALITWASEKKLGRPSLLLFSIPFLYCLPSQILLLKLVNTEDVLHGSPHL